MEKNIIKTKKKILMALENNPKAIILNICKIWNEEFDGGISKIEKKYKVKFCGWEENGCKFKHIQSKVEFFVDLGDFNDNELSKNQIEIARQWNDLVENAYNNYIKNMKSSGFEEDDNDEGYTSFTKNNKIYTIINYAKKEEDIGIS